MLPYSRKAASHGQGWISLTCLRTAASEPTHGMHRQGCQALQRCPRCPCKALGIVRRTLTHGFSLLPKCSRCLLVPFAFPPHFPPASLSLCTTGRPLLPSLPCPHSAVVVCVSDHCQSFRLFLFSHRHGLARPLSFVVASAPPVNALVIYP